MEEKIECMKCAHFYVTWDQAFPRGCKLFGFKTSKLPADLVRESTGKQCQNFESKAQKPEK